MILGTGVIIKMILVLLYFHVILCIYTCIYIYRLQNWWNIVYTLYQVVLIFWKYIIIKFYKPMLCYCSYSLWFTARNLWRKNILRPRQTIVLWWYKPPFLFLRRRIFRDSVLLQGQPCLQSPWINELCLKFSI